MIDALVATAEGLRRVGGTGEAEFVGRDVTALARATTDDWWTVVDGAELWRCQASWELVAKVPDGQATCVLAGRDGGVIVGTAGAHLLALDGDAGLAPLASFDEADGRDEWYTPWGGPPDTRSLAEGDGGLYANVHVGGILRSADGGATWAPTIDVHADVHQVLAVAGRPDVVAACAHGLAVSRDGGDTWTIADDGLAAAYSRAVAIAGDHVLVTASAGPGGQQSAVYRRPLAGDAPFERCTGGLPSDLGGNVDSGWLDGRGPIAVFATRHGDVFASTDEGATWEHVADGLPAVRGLALV